MQGIPMKKTDLLLRRLDEIGHSLAQSGHGLALIGLGSCGRELERLDDYSDLDFFAIVEDGHKQRYIDNLDWLRRIEPLAYAFQNTPDGHKILFRDGVFCEFAVFEIAELRLIPFAAGRIVWKRPFVEDSIAIPAGSALAAPAARTEDWLLGEALTNLYVGLCRYRRGEKLSAARFVQQFAVDRLIELHELKTPGDSTGKDPFSSERRLERRHPELSSLLPRFAQGYQRTPESAIAILDYLSANFEVNAAIASAIRDLCAPASSASQAAGQWRNQNCP